jgi:hypothetical protein
MSPVDFENGVWTPSTEEDKVMVRRQMNRLLETSHFKNSKRYPLLFRFIVEEALEGRGEFLKERLLGVRVFDRPADYDTAADPIVRVTIAEIRKRIAQYYHEEAHDSEMRIELLPGHYVPEFRPSKDAGYDHRQASESTRIWAGTPAAEPTVHSIRIATIRCFGNSAGPQVQVPDLCQVRPGRRNSSVSRARSWSLLEMDPPIRNRGTMDAFPCRPSNGHLLPARRNQSR